MRRLTLATIAVLLLGGLAAADFKAGLEAFQRGDYATALHEWQPLAEKGDANGQYNLGLLYNHGYGVPQDYAKAAEWYKKAAEQGNSNAEYNWGGMYSTRKGAQN